MVMFKRILPEELAEQNRGSTTALVYFYFWFSGIALFLAACYGAYELIRGTPGFSALRIIFPLIKSLLFMIGAWQIGRFNRDGVIFVAAGLALGSVGWIGSPPESRDVVFTIVTVIALIVAWQDLTSSPIGSSRKTSRE